MLFAFAVGVSAILILKIMGITPGPWTWGIEYNIFDWTHRFVYVAEVVGTWVLVEQVIQSLNSSCAQPSESSKGRRKFSSFCAYACSRGF